MRNTKEEVINVFHTKRKEIARDSIIQATMSIAPSKRQYVVWWRIGGWTYKRQGLLKKPALPA
ncbi:hypothetical protein [Palaeococcus pacificus]|nr:hypothetical protein [Palaeococcus pacificus]